jgi:glycosyltransferase involved in cell wall biosynthesis
MVMAARVQLVVPAFNESGRLPGFLRSLCEAVAGSPPVAAGSRVLVVDDGSGPVEREAMAEAVAGLAGEFPFLAPPLQLGSNRGKGGAVYAGWDAAPEGVEWLAFVDADGAVSAGETVRVLGMCLAADGGPGPQEALFAVRDPAVAAVERTPARRVLGRVFARVVRVLFRFPLRDTQCGLKAVPARVFRQVRPALSEFRFAFDIDLTARLLEAGVLIREVPIAWHESPGSKVRPLSAARMLWSALRLWARGRGRSRPPKG